MNTEVLSASHRKGIFTSYDSPSARAIQISPRAGAAAAAASAAQSGNDGMHPCAGEADRTGISVRRAVPALHASDHNCSRDARRIASRAGSKNLDQPRTAQHQLSRAILL